LFFFGIRKITKDKTARQETCSEGVTNLYYTGGNWGEQQITGLRMINWLSVPAAVGFSAFLPAGAYL
jgi:hypothetical protein